jgi:acetyl esterase/lipase
MPTQRFCWPVLIVLLAVAPSLFAQPAQRGPRQRPARAGAQEPQPGVAAHRDLVYAKVNGKELKLDVFVPEKADGPLPLIVWIHGGGWQSGSKSNCLPLTLGFVERGYVLASIDYRLSGEAIFPAQIEDCKAAIRWLRANAGEYHIDPDHLAAWGSSAGWHLVALVGTSGDVKEFDKGDHLDTSSRVQAVVDFFGPTDLVQFVQTPRYTGHAKADSPESKLLGGAVLENKDKAAKANPIEYITKDDPPFLIAHGTADPLVSPAQSELLNAALQKAGVESSLHPVAGAKHGGPEFSTPEMTTLVATFLDRHLKGKAAATTEVPR